MKTFRALLASLRPRQWTKNLVVFTGLVFSAQFMRLPLVLLTLQAFAAFCLAASAVYLFNDLYDRERDRQHPQKRTRPIASGALSLEMASVAAIALVAAALGWGFAIERQFGLLVLAYLAINLAYTLGLKHLVILDVLVISSGFVLRAVAGAVVIGVEISPWLLVVATLLALFLGFAKRRHELVVMGPTAGRHRASLEEYSSELLDQFMSVLASSTIIAYSLYTFTSSTAREHHTLMLTVPFVIYGIFRYLYLVYQKRLGGSPELILLKDKPMIITILLWTLVAAMILGKG